MKRIKRTLEEFLRDVGRLGAVPLGGKKKKTEKQDDKDIGRLIEQLTADTRYTKRIFSLYITVICIAYGAGILLMFYFAELPNTVGIVLGGIALGLIAIIEWIRRICREKILSDVTMSLLQKLPPAESVKAIEAIYRGVFRP